MEPIVMAIRNTKKVGEIFVEYRVERHIPYEMICMAVSTNLLENISKQMEASLNRLIKENV